MVDKAERRVEIAEVLADRPDTALESTSSAETRFAVSTEMASITSDEVTDPEPPVAAEATHWPWTELYIKT
jgi:hypothetical protein